GCACLEGEGCLVGDAGVPLDCADGLCRSPACAPGEAACVCARGVSCDAGNTCVDGVCQPEDCVHGSLGCACTGGLCQSGLRCRQDGVCVDGTGYPNNPCREDGSCQRGSRCGDEGVCVRCHLGA